MASSQTKELMKKQRALLSILKGEVEKTEGFILPPPRENAEEYEQFISQQLLIPDENAMEKPSNWASDYEDDELYNDPPQLPLEDKKPPTDKRWTKGETGEAMRNLATAGINEPELNFITTVAYKMLSRDLGGKTGYSLSAQVDEKINKAVESLDKERKLLRAENEMLKDELATLKNGLAQMISKVDEMQKIMTTGQKEVLDLLAARSDTHRKLQDTEQWLDDANLRSPSVTSSLNRRFTRINVDMSNLPASPQLYSSQTPVQILGRPKRIIRKHD